MNVAVPKTQNRWHISLKPQRQTNSPAQLEVHQIHPYMPEKFCWHCHQHRFALGMQHGSCKRQNVIRECVVHSCAEPVRHIRPERSAGNIGLPWPLKTCIIKMDSTRMLVVIQTPRTHHVVCVVVVRYSCSQACQSTRSSEQDIACPTHYKSYIAVGQLFHSLAGSRVPILSRRRRSKPFIRVSSAAAWVSMVPKPLALAASLLTWPCYGSARSIGDNFDPAVIESLGVDVEVVQKTMQAMEAPAS